MKNSLRIWLVLLVLTILLIVTALPPSLVASPPVYPELRNSIARENTSGEISLFFAGSYSGISEMNAYLKKIPGISYDFGTSLEFIFAPLDGKNIVESILNKSRSFGISASSWNASQTANPLIEAIPQLSGFVPVPYTIQNIRSAYNFSLPVSISDMGRGSTIVIVDAYGDPYLNYDLFAFDHVNGLPAANLTVFYPLGRPGNYNSTWVLETATDVEWAHAVAPAANIDLFISPDSQINDLFGVISYVLQKHAGNIISLSWGLPLSALSLEQLNAFMSIFSTAKAEGYSVVAASGDLGAYDGTNTLTVNFPAADPYVLSVGGTSLYEYEGTYSESAWGGTFEGSTFGSGGGYATDPQIYRPEYQEYASNSTYRGVPDVSMVADKYTGVVAISGGSEFEVGGTSLGAPIWSGIIALMDGFLGEDVGFVNPLLYGIAHTPLYPIAFNEITKGQNGFYNASAGWNPVTGLGTPDVSGLLLAARSILSQRGEYISFPENASNSTGISADISIRNITPESSYAGNYGYYYYIGFQFGNTGYSHFGIYIKNGNFTYLAMVRNGKLSFNNTLVAYSPIGKNMTFAISMNLTIGEESVVVGNETFSFPFISTNMGNSTPEIGALTMGSYGNFGRIYNATFSSIVLSNSTENMGAGSPLAGFIGAEMLKNSTYIFPQEFGS
ncbi:MAG: S53 family peptidase, partial [Thermoplasmataceae archaeon]